MAEPTSSGAAGVAGWKLIGGAAGVAAGGAGLATIVVMLMTPPRSAREWAVGLISTVLTSVSGGAYLVLKLGLISGLSSATEDADLLLRLMSMGGLIFACGLPGWAIVRALFTWIERRKGKDLGELVQDARTSLGDAIK